jgi:hypothetical protein
MAGPSPMDGLEKLFAAARASWGDGEVGTALMSFELRERAPNSGGALLVGGGSKPEASAAADDSFVGAAAPGKSSGASTGP